MLFLLTLSRLQVAYANPRTIEFMKASALMLAAA